MSREKNTVMIRSYFKIAWRNLMKHKLFSFINIFGLASAMTVCMLALIKIKDAFDYDKFHPNSNRTYRINSRESPFESQGTSSINILDLSIGLRIVGIK